MKKGLFFLLLILPIVSLTGCNQSEDEEPVAEGIYTPGTYTASADGYGGEIVVTITVDEDTITECTAQGDSETSGIGSEAIAQIPDDIVQADSIEVDGVSGATTSSKALLQAAASALEQAKGEEEPAEAKMAPGTYTASAYGFIAIEPLSVDVTVDEDSILDIKVDGKRESVAMVRSVNTYLLPRILEHQSVAVEAITGATATSNAVLQAVSEALTEALTAGGSASTALKAFQTPEPKVSNTETIDTDVLVIGMGAAGTAAALSSAEAQTEAGLPVNVLAIDKAGRYGGTGAFTGGIMGVNAPRYKEEFNDGEDYMDKDVLLSDWEEYTGGDAKMDILEMFLDHSGETIDWLYFDHDIPLTNPSEYFGSPYKCVYDYASIVTAEEGRDYGIEVNEGQNTMVDSYYNKLIEDYEKLGGEYMLETEAHTLLYDSDTNTIKGVKATGHDGTEYTINAKSVILATGGFAASEDMEIEYLSQNPYYEDLGGYWTMIGMMQNDGKMIESAVDLGAGTYHIDMAPMVHFATSNVVLHDYPVNVYEEDHPNYRRVLWYGWEQTWSLNDVPNALVLNSEIPWVNTHGERFTTEDAMFSWWISGPSYWAIWSEDLLEGVANNGFSSTLSTLAAGSQGGVPGDMPIPEIDEIVDKLIENGSMFKADTIEELAEEMDVPADTLASTIARYNQYSEIGVDEEFGKDPEKLLALGDGPFYAIKGYSAVFSTVGGLDIDANLNVLLEDGETPVNGLYAVGNDSGGVLYSNKEPYVDYGGAALGWAYTSGRLSGGNAVEYSHSQD